MKIQKESSEQLLFSNRNKISKRHQTNNTLNALNPKILKALKASADGERTETLNSQPYKP